MTAVFDYTSNMMPAGRFRDLAGLSDSSAIAKNSFQNRDMYLHMTSKLPRIAGSQQTHRQDDNTQDSQRRLSMQSVRHNSLGGH